MTYRFILAFLLALPALAQIGPLSVPNMAALRNLVPNPTKPVYVEGYYRQGDGGGGYYWVTNTVVGTNAYGGRILAAGGGRSWQLGEEITEIDVRQFGAIMDDGVDDLPQVSALATYLGSRFGGTIKIPKGILHVSSTINLPYRVSIKGTRYSVFSDGFSTNPNDSFYLLGSQSWIRLMSGANAPLIVANATNGWIRFPNKTLEDGQTGVDARQQESIIQDVVLYTRPVEHTSFNTDGVFVSSKWGMTMDNVTFFGFPGYAIRLLDCNAVNLRDIYIKGSAPNGTRGIFAWTCADMDWSNVSVGGVAGPGFWLAECWKMQGVNLYPWNSFRTNAAYMSTSVASDAYTLSATQVALESGDPVMVRPYDWVSDGTWHTNATLGTLPTGITSSNLYFAVKVSPGVYGIHTNRALALAGTRLPLSGFSGTNWLHTGPASGMFLSVNTRQNNFEGIRSDQQSDHGITIQNSVNNVIVGLTTNNDGGAYNGEVDTPRAGVYFGEYAINNSVQSASIHDCFFGGYAEPTASGNVFESMYKGIAGGSLAQRFDATSGNNLRPMYQTFNGVLQSQSFGTMSGGTLGLSNTLTLGNSSLGRVLDIFGNAAGVAAIRITRPSVATNEIGVTGGAIQFKNVGEDVTFMDFRTGTTRDLNLGNPSGAESTKTGRIIGEPATGTDVAGGTVHVRSGPGRGAGAASTVQVYTPEVGTTGSSAQSMVERARFDNGSADRDTAAWLWSRDSGTLRRVGVTNIDVGDGVTRSYLYLK